MSSITSTLPATMAVPFASPGVHRITVDEYERIIRAGALDDPDRVELVEISLTTLNQHRGKKLLAYARSGIPVSWIINLVDRHVEVYTGPGPAGYQSRVDFQPGQVIPVAIDGRQLPPIAVNDILPS